MHSNLIISQADRRPMYLQLMEQIRRRVAVGDWQPGHELPSIRALAAETQVSVITIKRAYLELERAGVIVTRQGKGSFIADTVDLGASLKREELVEHLVAAARIADDLQMDRGEVLDQLGEALDQLTKETP